MIKAGARYVQGQKHTDVVVVDGNLVTGQNGASAKRTAQVVVDQADRTIKRTVPALAAFPIQMRFFAPNNAHRVPALRPQVPGGGTRPSRRRNWNANERGVALSV